ncbi:MAG: hypothetical protein KDD65_01495 [Bacteroidetes bacterium]|nr:hypothetical protein [Bacteroidota bacterium]
MDDKKRLLHTYMKRIEELLEESYTLKRTRESWPRHVEIQAEIMNLCRKAADLHGVAADPYWMTQTAGGMQQRDSNTRAA